MRKFALYFFITALFTAPAMAADVAISRAIPGKTNSEPVEQNNTEPVIQNRAARRVNLVKEQKTETADNNKTVARGTVARTVVKPETNVVPRSNQKANVVSRGARKSTAVRTSLNDAVNTVGRNPRTEAASMNNTAAVRRAGVTLRDTTAEVGGRAMIIGTDQQTGSNMDEQISSARGRAGLFGTSKKKITAESIAEAKELLEQTADLNNTCQQQYNECMDQFCSVVDANQKRCSCSANLSRYEKAQKAVEEANAELNDVAQRIRYVGLSADEIRAILSATEAELAMDKTRDNTETRSMLEDIADMIKDPTSTTFSFSTSSSVDLSMLDMDFDSDSADLFSLDMFSSNSDISSKRGKELYSEATRRCKNVLKQCKNAGGTESQISGNYDLAIDKDCVAYEQGLKKLNDTLKSNVRSANLMLQKARLAVLQNKNQYDIKGCVAALDQCMLDDMVCGEDYIKCLDPTKVYIDENGTVVLGRNITNITALMQNSYDASQGYSNSKITKDFIQNSIGDTECGNNDGACIVNYLMTKIGTGQSVKDGGLCRAVLDKCQDFTYTQNGNTSTYNPYNEVVVTYIQRAMVNIKAAQQRIISDYASTCINEIASCYNQQMTQINSYSSTATIDNIYSILTGTCYNVALTCGYAVFAYDIEMGRKVAEIAKEEGVEDYDSMSDDREVKRIKTEYERRKELELIKGISQLFYQSMLCPDNSYYTDIARADALNPNNYVNDKCVCGTGYSVYNDSCVSTCPSGYYSSSAMCCESGDKDGVGKKVAIEGACVIDAREDYCGSETAEDFYTPIFVDDKIGPLSCKESDESRTFVIAIMTKDRRDGVFLSDEGLKTAKSRCNYKYANTWMLYGNWDSRLNFCQCPTGSELVNGYCVRPDPGQTAVEKYCDGWGNHENHCSNNKIVKYY